jgi:hypothetical protein
MVEIDYYSKYLKYKQKYLKQKNLQIGGDMIFLKIKIEYISKPTFFDITNQIYNLKCDNGSVIGAEINSFLNKNNIVYDKGYKILYKKNDSDEYVELKITETFRNYDVINNSKIKIKIQ